MVTVNNNDKKELTNNVDRLEIILSLMAIESYTPMSSALLSAKVTKEDFDKIAIIFDNYHDLIEEDKKPDIESFYNDLYTVRSIVDAEDVRMITIGFYQAERWQKVGTWFIRESGQRLGYQ